MSDKQAAKDPEMEEYERQFDELAEQIGQDNANQILRYYKNIEMRQVGSQGTAEDYDAAVKRAYQDMLRVAENAKRPQPQSQQPQSQETKNQQATTETPKTTESKETSTQNSKSDAIKKAADDLKSISSTSKEEIKEKAKTAAKDVGQKAAQKAQEEAMKKAREVLAENNKKKQKEAETQKKVQEATKSAAKRLASSAQTKQANSAFDSFVSSHFPKDDRTPLGKTVDKYTSKVKNTVKKIKDETIIDEVLTLAAIAAFKALL